MQSSQPNQRPTRQGARVVVSKGKKATTFSLRYFDADRRPVTERLGSDHEGWTDVKAQRTLEVRLADVAAGWRKPSTTTIEVVAREWLATYPVTKQLKRSTRESYKTIVEHLCDAIGHMPISDLEDVSVIDRYVADRLEDGYAAGTVNRHLNVLSQIVRSARKRNLMRSNPLELVDRPAEPYLNWRILKPAEISRVLTAFVELEADAADPAARAWVRQCSQVFAVTYGLGLRRGEILGLRWQIVGLADPNGASLRVAETFVRNRIDMPKSKASVRTIQLGRAVAEVLYARYAETAYQHDTDRVFCHPDTGGALNPKDYADTFRLALDRAKVGGYVRPFHDGRHSSITNAAAAGAKPIAIQTQAGHADMSTTQRYIDLAGVTFRDDALLAQDRMFGTIRAEIRAEVSEGDSNV